MNNALSNEFKGLRFSVILLCIISAYFTYNGISLFASTSGMGVGGDLGALLFSIGSFCALHIFWSSAIKFFAAQDTSKGRVQGVVFIVLWLPILISLSSWWNVAGIAGNEALEIHMQETVRAYEDIARESFEQNRIIEELLPDLALEIAKFTRAAEEEFTKGVYTGQSGNGAVYLSLTSIASRLADIEQLIQDHVRVAETTAKAVQAQLEVMREVNFGTGSPAERLAGLMAEADQLQLILAKANGQSLASSVKRAAEALPREANASFRLSQSENIAQAQSGALTQLQDDLSYTGTILGNIADQIAVGERVDLPSVRRINPILAVAYYAIYFIPAWIGGIGLDLALLAPILFYSMMIANKSTAQIRQDEILNLRVRDLVNSELAKDLDRFPGMHQGHSESLIDHHLGRSHK